LYTRAGGRRGGGAHLSYSFETVGYGISANRQSAERPRPPPSQCYRQNNLPHSAGYSWIVYPVCTLLAIASQAASSHGKQPALDSAKPLPRSISPWPAVSVLRLGGCGVAGAPELGGRQSGRVADRCCIIPLIDDAGRGRGGGAGRGGVMRQGTWPCGRGDWTRPGTSSPLRHSAIQVRVAGGLATPLQPLSDFSPGALFV
jgi:hypothetical protein